MQYTMYYEEQQKIDYDEYGRLKQQLLQKKKIRNLKNIHCENSNSEGMCQTKQCRTIICA